MEIGNFEYGNPRVNAAGFQCCGKPVGCTSQAEGCAYLHHPWKRAIVFGDTSVRCQATCSRPHPVTGEMAAWECSSNNGHDGDHTLRLSRPR